MACNPVLLQQALPRISGRTNQLIDLNVDFYNNGQLADPFYIQRVEIYQCSVTPANLVAAIPFVDCGDALYPAPACQESIQQDAGLCGTAPPTDPTLITGKYHLLFLVPPEFKTPDVYIDVWYFYPYDPCNSPSYGTTSTSGTNPCDCNDPAFHDLLVQCCHRFWIYPDSWYCNDNLQCVNFSFEPLSTRFNFPENKCLEVGLMPLPLYSYNKNLVNPLIPFLKPTITIGTQYCDVLVQDGTMEIGLRQGQYRSNPWTMKYNLNTSLYMRGSYWYQVKLTLPDGSTRVSQKFWFEIR